ncbi:galactose-1-phosphate uridylyltransferase [Symmachiella dynata]|uniref:galactose-1-phosphate uridylyltransferase n=1 Tax=Symmachiella dynata TaxID=2527995 RepID=UPI0030EC5663
MSEIRKDPIVDRWVIVATERAAKPVELVQQARTEALQTCPFCEGHEDETTPEILAYRQMPAATDGGGWHVRVIPNKYPAVTAQGNSKAAGGGFYHQVRGVGSHEVVIECPQHDTNLAELSTKQVGDVLTVYRDRLRGLASDERLAYALVFKNYGALAGASMEHCHSQILATPNVPLLVAEELAGSLQHHSRSGLCPYCALLAEELAVGSRVVLETTRFVVICPFASRFPFEMWILPRRHASHFEEQDATELTELAASLKSALRRLGAVLNDPAYNYYLHTAPLRTAAMPHFHWHLEVFPRLAQLAGFEHGSGMFINPIRPEHATELLRAALD